MGSHVFRWLIAGIVLGSIAVSGTLRWRARRSGGGIPRRLEPSWLIAGRVLIGGTLALTLLAAVIAPGWPAWSVVALPDWARWIGAAVAVTGSSIAISGLAWLGPNVSETTLTREGQRLVTSGPYRRVRHPLYAGGGIMLLGLALLAASWLLATLAVLAVAAIRIGVVPREEAALVERFGEAYLAYRRRTGALVPRLVGRS